MAVCTTKLRSSKEYGSFWQSNEFDLQSVVEAITARTERDPSPPPQLSTGPNPNNTQASSSSAPTATAGTEGPKLTRTQRDNVRKRRKRDPGELNALHVENSTPFQAQDFKGTSAPRESTGYKAKRDAGEAYDFLQGSYAEQIAQLNERGYDFLDPPPE